jgi:hypothetical protein
MGGRAAKHRMYDRSALNSRRFVRSPGWGCGRCVARSPAFTALTAKGFVGKGFGDLDVDWLRPFAVTAEVDYTWYDPADRQLLAADLRDKPPMIATKLAVAVLHGGTGPACGPRSRAPDPAHEAQTHGARRRQVDFKVIGRHPDGTHAAPVQKRTLDASSHDPIR